MASAEQQAWVERVLGVRMDDAAPADKDTAGAAVRLAKGLLLWNSTRTHVAAEVTKLQQAIVAEMQDHEEFDDIVAGISNLEEVMETLDDRLSDKLGELRAATSPADKTKLSAQARKIVTDLQAETARDELLKVIDNGNGFLPLTVKSRIDGALAAVLSTI